MRLKLTRTGGVHGIRFTVEADTQIRRVVYGAARLEQELAEPLVRHLEMLARAANLPDLCTTHAMGGGRADEQVYELEFGVGEEARHVRLIESEVPDRARPLLAFLMSLASGRMPSVGTA